MIPYPFLYGNYWENVAYWWNVEFWNASVQRAAVYEGAFTGTPETFPTTELSFDRSTGPRERLAERLQRPGRCGDEVPARGRRPGRGPRRHARQDASSRGGLNGWPSTSIATVGRCPKVVGTIRVFAAPGQTASLMRFLTRLRARRRGTSRPRDFQVTSNTSDWQRTCRRERDEQSDLGLRTPRGLRRRTIDAPRYSPIYGDPRSEASFVSYARSGGVLVTGIALADETGPC